MSVHYIQEHLQCKNYTFSNRSVFKHFSLSGNEKFTVEAKQDYVFVFLLEGSINVSGSYCKNHKLESNYMYSLGREQSFFFDTLTDCKFLLLLFDVPIIKCDQFSMLALKEYFSPADDTCVRVLPIKPQILSFLDNIIFYLENKMYCRHLQEIKQSEWFFLMRAFYSKQENAMFFAPLIEEKNEFVFLVKEKAETISTVNELAEACNMTTKTFTRNFKKYFNTTPKKWLQLQKRQEVKLELLRSQDSMKVLSNHLGFSSASHLSSYCKKHFDQTPQDLKKSKV